MLAQNKRKVMRDIYVLVNESYTNITIIRWRIYHFKMLFNFLVSSYQIYSLSSLSSNCADNTDFSDPLYHSHLSGLLNKTKCPQRTGRLIPARPWVVVHRRTSLMSSSMLLQLCLACLARLICIFFEMEGKWPYIYCFVECCFRDLFKTTRSILV